jgi:hypothetical protein
MISETTWHATQVAADHAAKRFKDYWGWGYSPSATVYYSESAGLWACYLKRESSCD